MGRYAAASLFAVVSLGAGTGSAQDGPFPNLQACRDGAFSTEEDFISGEPVPFDGNPYVSDDDVLSPNGQVCARNIELLQPRFDVSVDLGLDALDILDIERGLIDRKRVG